jgi:hypothetical protein
MTNEIQKKERRIQQKKHQKIYDSTHKEQKKERMQKYNKKYRKTHPNYNKQNSSNYRRKCRIKVLISLGNKCVNPYNIDHSAFEKEPDYIKCLQIDHINGGGRKQKMAFKGNSAKYHNYIFNHLLDYQLLCPTCNWLKKIKNNEK